MRVLYAASLICLALTCGGCDWNANAGAQPAAASNVPAPPEVVMINLQDVLERLGRDAEINKALQAKKEEQKQQIAAQSGELDKQYADKKKEFGDAPTDDQKKQLQSLQLRLGLQLRQIQAQLNTEFTAFRQQLVNRFREEVKPIARDVAKERNASIVLARDDGVVLAYESDVDITDDVVERMLKGNSAAKPAPAGDAGKAKTAP